MATTKSLLRGAALVLCVVIKDFLQAEAQSCGGFASTCMEFSLLDGVFFSAYCLDDSQNYKDATIALNSYIGDNNGNLVLGEDFTHSCQNIGWNELGQRVPPIQINIEATCLLNDGKYASFTSSFDINTRVGNDNGVLTWHNC